MASRSAMLAEASRKVAAAAASRAGARYLASQRFAARYVTWDPLTKLNRPLVPPKPLSAYLKGRGSSYPVASSCATREMPPFIGRTFTVIDQQRKKVINQPATKVVFEAKEEDLYSHEALWALYERWCKHFKIQRDHDEMTRRFDTFRASVYQVHGVNNSDLPLMLEINKFADEMFIPDEEALAYIDPQIQRRIIGWHALQKEKERRRSLVEEWERAVNKSSSITTGPKASTN